VLELGCAAALNLIPQSVEFPQSHFVGVDLSERQVEHGDAIIMALCLDNIEVRQADILEIDDSWGQFDYILCHGVYSWVPENVRQKILMICKENLSPNGVALVSHNVLPGWNFRGTIRDMMLFHISNFEEPEQQLLQARAVLDFMAENCASDTAYGQMLREELKHVQSADDQYLFHDHLEADNHAIYFHQFAKSAEAVGLQYLGDTNVASMLPTFLTPNAKKALMNAPLIAQQQYMDFLTNKKFRSNLLCHQSVTVTRNMGPERLKEFQLSISIRPQPFEPRFDAKEPVDLYIGSFSFSISTPMAMAVMEHLSKTWPRPISVDELYAASIERLATCGTFTGSLDDLSVDHVTSAVMGIFTAGLIDFCIHPPSIATQVSRRPLATPLARFQAAAGKTVTNQRHENVRLDEFSRYLVALLDSEHDHALLYDKVQAAIASGNLAVPKGGPDAPPVDLTKMNVLVDRALTSICGASILTS